jgi:two-component system phosphate regulon sensor histidine kinase PhoR
MPPLFWLDVTALGISAVITISLTLIVLGTGPRRALNRSFALFALMDFISVVSELPLRLSLWLELVFPAGSPIGDPSLWLEMIVISTGLMSVFSLMFTALFLNRRTRRTDWAVVLGLMLVAAFAVPTFRHQLFFDPRMNAGGVVTKDASVWGWVGMALASAYMVWSLVLFWRGRHRTTEFCLALGMLIILTGIIVGGSFEVHTPFISLSNALGAAFLGYGVISRQILNPLREQAEGLQHEIAGRKRMEGVLRRRTAQLEALEAAAAAVNSTLDYDEVLSRILEQISRTMPQAAASIMLVEGDTARVLRGHGYEQFGSAVLPSSLSFDVADVVGLRRMQETGQSLVIPDVRCYEGWVCLRPEHAWIKSYAGVPIRIRDRIVGALNVNSAIAGFFSQADADHLQALANHAATAIENAGLYRELQDHAERLEQRVQERTAELQAQYARLDAILASTTDGIVVADREGHILQMNPVALAWLTQALSPEEAGRLREGIQELARQAGDGAAPGETPEVVLELTGVDLELSAAPVVAEGMNESPAVAVNIHDVSHLKALDRMKTRFITNISHELRTPITSVKLYVHLLQHQPEKSARYLDILAQEADRLARLIEDILEMARIDAGRLELNPRPACLNELAEIVVNNHRELAREQGLTLEHRLVDPGPATLADPVQMMRVLNNLLGNAIRFTPQGGEVLVSTGVEEAEGRTWATVTVADTGMGIPEEELPHIFDRFFRGKKPREMQLTGTGLGLSIVREIMGLHGGRVTVESKGGAGSTFTVWLPFAVQERNGRQLGTQLQRYPRVRLPVYAALDAAADPTSV